MAKLTPAIKVKIFQQLNERELPWKNSRFVINEDEYDWLGNGNFSEVYVMEEVADPSVKYAVKIIGFNEHRRIHQSDIESYKKEPILQYGLANQCNTVVKIMDTEVISIKLDDRGNVEDARSDDYGVEKPGWLVLVLIKMEKLSPIIEQNFTGDYSFKIPALKASDEKEILSLAINIAEALDTSHSMKIMHRDVKLENIFYDESRQIYKLGDFGIARITNQGSASTKGAGTLGYEAPEVEGGNGSQYSYQADIYSFGVTIYLLMNELKFPGSSGYHVNREVQYNPNAQIELPEYGAEELKQYICSLIVFNSQERPKSMREVLEHLDMIYSNSYGERKSNKIDKKKPKMAADVEILKTSLNKTVSEVKYIKEEVVEHKDVIGSIVAEVKKQPVVEKDVDSTSAEQVNLESHKTVASIIDSNPKQGIIKGILGLLGIIIGFSYFAVLSGESFQIIKTPMVLWSLIANTIISFAAMFMKFAKQKKMPYLIYFILFCFSLFVMVTGGVSWLYIVIAIGLFIGGVSEILALNLSAWICLLVKMLLSNQLNGIVSINLAWVFFALILVGFILCEQYDKQEDIFSLILGNEISGFLIGILIIVVGIVIWILNKIPAVNVADLLMKMHFIYVGLILWLIAIITAVFGERRSS